jgi:hypothetical protein
VALGLRANTKNTWIVMRLDSAQVMLTILGSIVNTIGRAYVERESPI